MLTNVGSGGAPAAAGAAAAGGAVAAEAAPAAEEKKEEGTKFRWTSSDSHPASVPHFLAMNTNPSNREGGVRRGHGLRSVRLSVFVPFTISRFYRNPICSLFLSLFRPSSLSHPSPTHLLKISVEIASPRYSPTKPSNLGGPVR